MRSPECTRHWCRWITAALMALSAGACGADSPRLAGVPSGEGWHCFTPHPDGSRAASCHRTREACVRALADAMEDARHDGVVIPFSSCTPAQEVFCAALDPSTVVCMARDQDCEQLRDDLDPQPASCLPTR
jgi:hypothetical protein